MKVFGSDMGEIFPQHAQQLDPAGEHRLVGRIVGADPADIFVHDLFEALKSVYRQDVAWRNGSRSEEHTSELQSLMRISYAVFCLKKKRRRVQLTVVTT